MFDEPGWADAWDPKRTVERDDVERTDVRR